MLKCTESSHNGIAAVLKTAVRNHMRVRVPHSPPSKREWLSFSFFVFTSSFYNKIKPNHV